jgi:hypothetical protein
MLTRRLAGATLAAAIALLPAAGNADPRDVFWAGVRRIGLVLESIGKLGEGDADAGAVWIADVAGGPPRAVTREGGYAWPVPDGRGAIVALRGGRVVRIDAASGATTSLADGPPLRKLVGVAADGTVLAVADGGPLGRPALIEADGKVVLLPEPAEREQRRDLGVLLSESRLYDGGRRLTVDRTPGTRGGFDVYLNGQNLSRCGGDACGQPALSPDGRHVVFIRAARQ